MPSPLLAHRLTDFYVFRGYNAEGTRLFFVHSSTWTNIEVKPREFGISEHTKQTGNATALNSSD